MNHAVPAVGKMVLVACPFCNCSSAMPSGSSSYKCAQCSQVTPITYSPNAHTHVHTHVEAERRLCAQRTGTHIHMHTRSHTQECARTHTRYTLQVSRAIGNSEYHTTAATREGAQRVPPSDLIHTTALHAAVRQKGNAEVVRALISGNADLNARTLYGNTPLHLAASIRKRPLPNSFYIELNYGADV